jgi:SH3-like domain-containing protein
MSDKYNKDDFSWLDDDDNNKNQGQDDDFPDLDWLTDIEDNEPKRDERRLGVTGELPWLDDSHTQTEEEASEDTFDWSKTDQPQAKDNRRLGVTGELSWLGGTEEETETPSTPRSGVTGQLDWRKSSFEEQLEAAERAAGVDWGRDAADDNTYSVDDNEDALESEIPEWLRGAEPVDEELASFADAFDATADVVDDTALPSWMDGNMFDDNEDETALIEDEGDTNEEDLVPPAWMVDVPEDINESPSWLTGVTRSAEVSEDDLATEDGLSDLFGDDLFADFDTAPTEEADDFDLLSQLTANQGSTGLTDLLNSTAVETPDPPEIEDDDDLAWLRDFEPEATSPAPPVNRQTEIQDVDDFFASLEDTPLEFDENLDELANTDVEFDDLFKDPAFNEVAPAQPQTPDTFRPEWLSNVSISEVSAAAIVRKQQDRPLEDLPERLQILHEEGLNLPAASNAPINPEIAQLIPDVRDALPPAPVHVGASSIAEKIVLTPDQTRKVGILANLSASSAAAAEALLSDQPEARPARRFAIRFDRLLITVLIALSVILPFFGIARIGDLPPSAMVGGSRQERAFEQVDGLESGDLVLFAAEYGATSAGELDTYTDAILRHAILRGARPVIVSSNPVGLLRADNRASAIAEGALVRNRDYYVGRYIVGSTIGMRSFSQDVSSLTRLDVQGRSTGLEITSLDDFALIVVIVENTESIRTWVEQVAPLTEAPVLFASSYAASPLALPYEAITQGGLLVGYQDAYTYSRLVDEIALDAPPIILPTETSTPTAEPTEEPVILTEEIEASPTATEETVLTEEVTQTVASTATIEPTLTGDPTQENAPAVDATTQSPPSPTVEATIEEAEAPTETPRATSEPQDEEVFGEVSAQQAVNVRQGPGRDFPVVGVLQPGDRVPVLGADDDNSWYNIRLEDGTEGWISAQLLELEGELPEARLVPPSSRGMTLNVSYRRVAQRTEEPEPTAEAVTADLTTTIPYRDERWFGMTLGIITIVLIIAIGNLFSVIQRRRGR